MTALPVSGFESDAFTRRTARLVLSLVEETDAESYHPLMADGRLTRHLAWAPHADVHQTTAVLRSLVAARKADRGVHWAVRTQDGELAGLVSLIDLRYRHLTWRLDRGELAYWIRPECQGRGFATEASEAVVEMGFTLVRLHKLLVAHAVGNPASGAVARRLGFSLVGTYQDAFKKDDTWHDLVYYERRAEEQR